MEYSLFESLLKSGGFGFEKEYMFHPVRRWRFDYIVIGYKIAIEIEGGVHSGGRHVRGTKYKKNCKKYKEAQKLGWCVLRYTPGMIRRVDVVGDIMKCQRKENAY